MYKYAFFDIFIPMIEQFCIAVSSLLFLDIFNIFAKDCFIYL